jgi:hypothetical protein
MPADAATEVALVGRLRQAALGCTIHAHGPLNALAAILERHAAGEIDGRLVLEEVASTCRRRLESLAPLGIDAIRERKVLLVVETLRRGLS